VRRLALFVIRVRDEYRLVPVEGQLANRPRKRARLALRMRA
jgi:hypothetical protein